MNDHQRKLKEFVYNKIKKLNNPKILEFGVRDANSTKMFLDLAEKNDGSLISVDINDYSKLFSTPRWTFIQTRDDNFHKIDQIIKEKLDVVFLDSFHEAKHVEKIFIHYYNFLKKGGFFFIDDISWLPYLKNNFRNSFYAEINNKETFNSILKIYNSNIINFDLEFTFISSGFASIYKISDNDLFPLKKMYERTYSIKNVLRLVKNFILK